MFACYLERGLDYDEASKVLSSSPRSFTLLRDLLQAVLEVGGRREHPAKHTSNRRLTTVAGQASFLKSREYWARYLFVLVQWYCRESRIYSLTIYSSD